MVLGRSTVQGALEMTDDEILRFVEAWIDDLARGDYRAAFDRTRHDPYYAWTPALIEAVINGYGLPEPHRSVAPVGQIVLARFYSTSWPRALFLRGTRCVDFRL